MTEEFLLIQNEIKIQTKLKGLFCTNCEIIFEKESDHKQHYKTQLHKYNLKRKILKLVPINQEQFNQQIQQYKNSQEKQSIPKEQNTYCQICRKAFKSLETFNQHEKSKKHIKNSKNKQSIKQENQITKIEDTALHNISKCLFCNQNQNNFKDNLEHMNKQHSFFIVDESNCKDKEKIIKILSKNIFVKKECIFCCNIKSRTFKNFGDVQKHMLDKGHCMMNNEFMQEFSDHYQFTEDNQRIINKYFINKDGSLNISEEDLKDFQIIEIAQSVNSEDDQDEWISVDEEELKEFEKTEISKNSNLNEANENETLLEKIMNPANQYDFRNFMLLKAQKLPNGELKLPNKKILGNRKYAIYYKQYHRDYLDINKMRKYLTDKNIIKEEEALVEYQFDDIKSLYLKNKQLEKKEKIKQNKLERNKIDKIQFRFVHDFKKVQMNTIKRHNKVLTTHFRERNQNCG